MSHERDPGSREEESKSGSSLGPGMSIEFRREKGESVLAAIERLSGRRSRVHLRDATQDASPVVMMRREGVDDDSQYRIMGEIATGGVGIVYRGRDRDLGRDVALKVLRPEFKERQEVLDRFVEEAQIEGQLQHPGIVPIYGLGLQKDGRPYFAMKLVQGQTLAALLADRPDPTQQRRRLLRIFEQICQTIAYAHSRGVVHRDLKPANVMIGAFGEVQVMDWGFAKVLGREERVQEPLPNATIVATLRMEHEGSQSIAGSIMGTPAYMPPEQAMGQVDELDERCDIFALGALLCEILTGQPPYVGKTSDVLLMAAQGQLKDAFARLDACVADESLINITKRLLAPMAKNRPRDALRVAHAIGKYLAEVEDRARKQELVAAEANAQEQEEKAQLAREELRAKQELAVVEEERAKAERERARTKREQRKAQAAARARRSAALLCGVLLVAVLAGVGFFAWNGREARARAAETQRIAQNAIQEARELASLKRWDEAESATANAMRLAEAAGPTLVAEVEELRDEVRQGTEREEAERAEILRRQAFIDQLAEIRLGLIGAWDGIEVDRELKAAFQEFGIDIEKQTLVEAAASIAETGYVAEIASVLDIWAHDRRTRPELKGDWRPLDELARKADPDPWRTKVRDAIARRESRAVQAIADTAPIETLHPRSLYFLALCLQELRAFDAASKLLQRALDLYPGHIWLNHARAEALSKARPPRRTELIRHATRVVAAREGSAGAWIHLSRWLSWSGNYVAAREAVEQAERLAPDSARVKIEKGYLYQRIRDKRSALRAYRKAVALRPNSARGHLACAGVLKTELAVQAARKAIEVDPTGQGYYDLAYYLAQDDKPDQAVREYRKAAEMLPRHVGVRRELAVLHSQRGDHIEAIEVAREAVEVDPNSAAAHGTLGIVCWRAEKLDEAEAAFERSLELDPLYYGGHAGLGLVCMLRRDEVGAIRHLREMARIAPSAGAMTSLAHAYRHLCLYQQAEASMAEAVRMNSKSVTLPAFLAEFNSFLGRFEEADYLARDAIDRGEKYFHGFRAYAQVYLHEGEFGEALSAIDECVQMHDGDGDAWFLKGKLHAIRLELEEAEAAFERALKLEKVWDHLGALHMLPPMRMEEARWLKALCEKMAAKRGKLRDVLTRKYEPSDPAECFTFATLAFRSGKPQRATELYEKATGREGLATLWAAGAAIGAGKRPLALRWLREELARCGAALAQEEVEPRVRARHTLYGWRTSSWLASVRDESIADLPEAEAKEWTTFWTRVDKLLEEKRS